MAPLMRAEWIVVQMCLLLCAGSYFLALDVL